jgi:hypothetical protein
MTLEDYLNNHPDWEFQEHSNVYPTWRMWLNPPLKIVQSPKRYFAICDIEDGFYSWTIDGDTYEIREDVGELAPDTSMRATLTYVKIKKILKDIEDQKC